MLFVSESVIKNEYDIMSIKKKKHTANAKIASYASKMLFMTAGGLCLEIQNHVCPYHLAS